MNPVEFAELRRFLKARSGLDLGPDKAYLAESRLGPVWRDAGLASLSDLVAALRRSRDPDLTRAVIDAMATNETMFFRDKGVFDALRTALLPRLVAARAATRRLRIWSAAASTGQEAYSIAMLLAELCPPLGGWQVTILGTDVSRSAIARARSGCYSQFEVQRGLPIRSLLRHFRQSEAGWTLSPEIRRMVTFEPFNLLDDVSSLGRFDVVLCRNLLIYMDTDTKVRVLSGLERALAPDGALALGASETLVGLSDGLAPHPDLRGFFVHGVADAASKRRVAAG